MHRDVEAADRTLMRLSDLLRLTLENIGQQEIPLQAELDFLVEVPPDRADALRRSPRRPLRRPARDARRARAEPDPAAARRERDQARRREEVGPGPHRHLGPPRGRQAADGSARRRRGALGGRADRAAERHRRLDDARAAAAPLRRRLPLRVPSPACRPVGRRRHSLADGGQGQDTNTSGHDAGAPAETPRVAAAGRLATVARQHQ